MPKLTGATGDLPVAPVYLRELREGQPVIIEDTTEDPRTVPLADKMRLGHTLALLDVPLAHSDQLVGLLCFDSDRPRKWHADESTTLVEVAQYLSLALRDAHLQRSRKAADREVRATSLRLRTVIENLQTGILVEDKSRPILNVNSKLCEMLGIGSPGCIVGKECLEATEQFKHLFSDPEDYVARINECVSQGQVVHGEALQIADGRKFERDYVPIKFDGGTVGSLWNYEDVTEREHLEEQIVLSQKMESIGTFVSGLAHDFGNMLTPIMSYCELLARVLPTEERSQGYLREIRLAGDRAADITGKLLRFLSPKLIEPSILDLNDLVLGVDQMLRRLIGEDIELITVPSPELWSVKIDRSQMESVLVNLAANSRDAMPSGGKLIIQTANVPIGDRRNQRPPGPPDIEYVLLRVTDTGLGIPEEEVPRVFEPFFTTKQVGDGGGLGLSTCYRIVTQNGGHIVVESEPGHTEFRVYLPRAKEVIEPVPDQRAYCDLPSGTETIMIVEDEEIVRTAARTILEGLGYNVLDVACGDEALRLAQQLARQQIHLLLSDVIMPLMGGRELAPRFREVHPETKVLFASGYLRDAAGLPEETGFINKPFTPTSLAQRVRGVLDS